MTEAEVKNEKLDAAYVIEADHLAYQVGRQRLLSGIQLKIRAGEHWLVYGMNGCGKTTLLSILAGFQQQTEGTLKVFGQPFTNENVLAQRRRIGWVSSSFFDARYHRERVLDIVLSGRLGTYGTDATLTSADYRRAQTLLETLGLGDKREHSYDRLSKGQRQNVLLARAFMQKPEILLLDEPCSGLDALAKSRFMQLLETILREETLTVLFVSHEIAEVQNLFDHALLLRNGRMFAQGATRDLFTEQTLSTFFQQKVEVCAQERPQIVPADAARAYAPEVFL